jgi:hypothetical protein
LLANAAKEAAVVTAADLVDHAVDVAAVVTVAIAEDHVEAADLEHLVTTVTSPVTLLAIAPSLAPRLVTTVAKLVTFLANVM